MIKTEKLILPKCTEDAKNLGYHLLLAVSTDSLYVITKDKELVETIRDGKDKKGYLVLAKDEDAFLDAILLFKDAIDMCDNPLNIIL
jgi:glycosyltransferase involved in cell wall biosynthesis